MEVNWSNDLPWLSIHPEHRASSRAWARVRLVGFVTPFLAKTSQTPSEVVSLASSQDRQADASGSMSRSCEVAVLTPACFCDLCWECGSRFPIGRVISSFWADVGLGARFLVTDAKPPGTTFWLLVCSNRRLDCRRLGTAMFPSTEISKIWISSRDLGLTVW